MRLLSTGSVRKLDLTRVATVYYPAVTKGIPTLRVGS